MGWSHFVLSDTFVTGIILTGAHTHTITSIIRIQIYNALKEAVHK